MSSDYEAFKNAYESLGRTERIRKAKALLEDYQTLRDPPEALTDDIAALCDCEDFEEAKSKLERL